MDSLTQIVLGASVGEAVLGKKAGNKALLYGAIAGTIPDMDVLANYFTDTLTAIEIHRGFTHSVVFSLIFAPVFGWIVSKIERKSTATRTDWTKLMFLGLITHPMLDSFTTWGTQLFWPLDFPVAFQNIFVIDPLYTLPFLFFLILTLFQKRTSPKRKKYNRLGLIASSSYLLITFVLKGITYIEFKNAVQDQQISYSRMETKPAPLNAILWSAHIETEDAYLLADYSLFDTQPISFHRFPKNHHLIESLAHEKNIQRLIKISEGWYVITENSGQLYFNDLRFGLLNNDPENPVYTFSYKIVHQNGHIAIEENKKTRENAKELLADLWVRIQGN